METTEEKVTVAENTELSLIIKNSGLEEAKQNIIAETLGNFFNKAEEWNATIKSIVINDISEVGKMKMAKEGRLTLKNMRLEGEKVIAQKRSDVKMLKSAFDLEDKLWLKAGQMMEATFKHLENQLEEKEKFAETFERNRIAKLQNERVAEALKYNVDASLFPLGSMNDDLWASQLEGYRLVYEKKIADEFAAEKAKIEVERLDKLESERKLAIAPYAQFISELGDLRNMPDTEFNTLITNCKASKNDYDKKQEEIRLQNEKLQKELDLKEAQRVKEQAAADKLLEEQRKAADLKAKKEKEIADKKLAAEKEAKAKIQKELQDKKDAEAKAEKERFADEKKKAEAAKTLAMSTDKNKLSVWVEGMVINGIGTENLNPDSIKIAEDIMTKFTSFKTWAKSQIETL